MEECWDIWIEISRICQTSLYLDILLAMSDRILKTLLIAGEKIPSAFIISLQNVQNVGMIMSKSVN